MTYALHSGPVVYASKVLGAAALSDGVLPPWLTLTRTAGPASWQTGPAENGKTFIAYDPNLAANTPRFHYVPAANRRMLLIEPARTNEWRLSSAWADVAPADNIIDGFTGNGTPGTHYETVTGGPDGYSTIRFKAGCPTETGHYRASGTYADSTQYTASSWLRVESAVAAGRYLELMNTNSLPLRNQILIPTAVTDWVRCSGTFNSGTGAGNVWDLMRMSANTALTSGQIRVAQPQSEIGPYASTWIPTSGGAGTRAVETCSIDASRVNGTSGYLSFLWSPQFSSAQAIAAGADICLFKFAVGAYLYTHKTACDVRISNGGTLATYPGLKFAAGDVVRFSMQWSPTQTILRVNGVTVVGGAWTPITPAPELGSSVVDGWYPTSAAYGDIILGNL